MAKGSELKRARRERCMSCFFSGFVEALEARTESGWVAQFAELRTQCGQRSERPDAQRLTMYFY
jgi:hypothetical protein